MNKKNKIVFLISIVFLSFSSSLYSQVFQKNYQASNFHHFIESVQQISDGGFVFHGWRLDISVPLMKMNLVKTNNQGVIEWKKEYCKCISAPPLCLSCGTPSTMGGCVQETSDGGFIMSGSTEDKLLLVKTNATGDVIWSKTYGSNSYGKYVRQTNDGGYISVGNTGNYLFIVKTDANGNLQWDRAYQISSNYKDAATDVEQLNNGDFIVTGYSSQIYNPGVNADTTTDIVLLRLSSSGTLLWAKTFGQDNTSEEGHAVRKTSDGGYVVAGHTSQTTHPLSATDVFLWKFNSSDAPVFQNSYKVGGFFSLDVSFGYAAQETIDGGYALFGVTTGYGLTSISYFNNFLLKLDNNANPVFCKSYKDSLPNGGVPFNLGYTIWNDGKQLNNGGYLIGGSGIMMSGMGLGYKLIKTNSLGESGCSERNVNPVKYTYAPAAEPRTLTNLATGTSANINMFVSNPPINEELICIVTCTAMPGNDTTICQSSGPFQLGMYPSAINGTPPYTYNWEPPTGLDDPSSPNPTYTPSTSVTYTLTIEDSEGCQSSAEINITVLPDADATINWPGYLCYTDNSVILTAAEPGGIWSGTGIVNPNTGEFSPSSVGIGSYWVYYTISGLCGDKDSVKIVVTGPLDASITPAGPYCLHTPPVNLTAQDSGGTWYGQGITNATLGTFDPQIAGVGTHMIKYIIPGSCGDRDSTYITVLPSPTSTVTSSNETCMGAMDGTIDITISGGTPTYTIRWNNDSVTQIQSNYTITHLPPALYVITIKDNNGCKEIKNVSINAASELCAHNIYVPNIFSPNGDGNNDILIVRGEGIKELVFRIFDRWGNKIFESTNQSNGWDGTYKNKEMNPGVYVYYLKATMFDSQVIQKKGNVTLVR